MAIVSVVVEDPGRSRARVAALFHKQFQAGLGAVLKAIDAREPLLEQDLFPRGDPTFAERFIDALDELGRMEVAYAVFVRFPGPALGALRKVTPSFVRNLIAGHAMSEEEAQRQVDRELGESDD